MKDKWLDFYKDTWKGYKVSYDEHLKDASKELFNLFDNAELLYESFPSSKFNKESYRKAFVHNNYWKEMEVPSSIYSFFKENFIDYLDIDDKCMQLKVEEFKHIDNTSINQHLSHSRVQGIIPSTAKHTVSNPEYQFRTAWWHTDMSLPLNNMVMMIYVEDVEEGNGEFVVADPIIELHDYTDRYSGARFATTKELRDKEAYIKAGDISSNHLTGPAGTVLGFNSHILHRANIPHKHRRRCIHLNIESDLQQHRSKPYDYHFHKDELPKNEKQQELQTLI